MMFSDCHRAGEVRPWQQARIAALDNDIVGPSLPKGQRHDAGVASDCNLEQPSDEMELADNLTDAHPPGLSLPNRMHGFVTLDRAVGSPERAEAFARSHPPLDSPMILLQDVIQVLHRPQSTSTPQRAF